jgi:hypothetical protein
MPWTKVGCKLHNQPSRKLDRLSGVHVIVLRFEDADQDHLLRVGPFPYVRLNGPSICAPGGEELAVAASAKWHIGQERFYAIALESPVRIEFENHDGQFPRIGGDFTTCRVLDGLIRAGKDYAAIAVLDYRTNLWYAFEGGTLHAAVVLRSS